MSIKLRRVRSSSGALSENSSPRVDELQGTSLRKTSDWMRTLFRKQLAAKTSLQGSSPWSSAANLGIFYHLVKQTNRTLLFYEVAKKLTTMRSLRKQNERLTLNRVARDMSAKHVGMSSNLNSVFSTNDDFLSDLYRSRCLSGRKFQQDNLGLQNGAVRQRLSGLS